MPMQVMNEISVMQQAGFHPNLVHFKGWYRDPQDGCMCLVMGYCEGGSLAALLRVSTGPIVVPGAGNDVLAI